MEDGVAMKIVHIKGAVLLTKSSLIPSEVNSARCMAKCETTPPYTLWERWEKRLQRAWLTHGIALNHVLELSYGKTDTPFNHLFKNLMYQDICTLVVQTSHCLILIPDTCKTHTYPQRERERESILCYCCSCSYNEELMGVTRILPSSKWTITSYW